MSKTRTIATNWVSSRWYLLWRKLKLTLRSLCGSPLSFFSSASRATAQAKLSSFINYTRRRKTKTGSCTLSWSYWLRPYFSIEISFNFDYYGLTVFCQTHKINYQESRMVVNIRLSLTSFGFFTQLCLPRPPFFTPFRSFHLSSLFLDLFCLLYPYCSLFFLSCVHVAIPPMFHLFPYLYSRKSVLF